MPVQLFMDGKIGGGGFLPSGPKNGMGNLFDPMDRIVGMPWVIGIRFALFAGIPGSGSNDIVGTQDIVKLPDSYDGKNNPYERTIKVLTGSGIKMGLFGSNINGPMGGMLIAHKFFRKNDILTFTMKNIKRVWTFKDELLVPSNALFFIAKDGTLYSDMAMTIPVNNITYLEKHL